MKKFVVFFAALLVVISSFGVQGQPNYEPQHYPNVPIRDNSVMNVQEGEQISHLASRFFFNSKNGGRRGGNAGSHGKKVTKKPKLTE
ncbi:Protein CBG17068 [Caenorhabditis briggsae]|uniref:Protein CBG17068 n=1 Tax=Caenorhabditis briggsae TaxID=6238 RepID=A8XQG3_CAEBR|nr:Protein CBG17068 [Caenorhabditis briggsae]CAP34888.1 Protein CBG17068 [Caenorhabditis briggsae]